MEEEEEVKIIDIEKPGVEEASLHGVTNLMEAAKHICLLDLAWKSWRQELKWVRSKK